MNNTLYFLRHGHTKVDKVLPVSQWVLSSTGEKQADKLAQDKVFKDIDIIVSSTEQKAYQTTKPTAAALGLGIIQLEEICELDRDKGDFVSQEEYEMRVKVCVEHPDQSVYGWETATHALERFSKKIDELNKQYNNKKILIVGHGFTINMFFAKLLGELEKVYERLGRNDFADWGIVKDGEVIKDIAK
jgi:2,3-bisphosphoglycerate-dependent phosphoglycerate mutase